MHTVIPVSVRHFGWTLHISIGEGIEHERFVFRVTPDSTVMCLCKTHRVTLAVEAVAVKNGLPQFFLSVDNCHVTYDFNIFTVGSSRVAIRYPLPDEMESGALKGCVVLETSAQTTHIVKIIPYLTTATANIFE